MRSTLGLCALTLLAACTSEPEAPPRRTIVPSTRPDAGALGPDAGEGRPTPAVAVACTHRRGDVYSTAIEPFDPTERGEIVRCAEDESFARDNLAARIGPLATGLEVVSGSTQYLISYREERAGGSPGVGIARLFVPDVPRTDTRPIVVVAHGTSGLADRCAPSTLPVTNNSAHLALPWVGAGFVTVMPDYAGLGNEGVHGYGNDEDTAHSVLDAARAAYFAVTPGSVDQELVLVGHDLGGGAVLAAQSIARSYLRDLTVRAVVSFAGLLIDSAVLGAFRFPDLPIEEASGLGRAALSLSLYADAANSLGLDRAGAPFHPDVRAFVTQAVETSCIQDLATELGIQSGDYVPPLTLGALLDPDFREDVVRCVAHQSPCNSQPYVDRLSVNRVTPDPAGAPILISSGADDEISAPARQKCLIEQLGAARSRTCLFEGRDHATILPAGAPMAVDWVISQITGAQEPECPSALDYPTCGS